eukprot:g11755.t1
MVDDSYDRIGSFYQFIAHCILFVRDILKSCPCPYLATHASTTRARCSRKNKRLEEAQKRVFREPRGGQT